MKTLHTSVLSLVILLSAGCCATTDLIRGDYTAADRATYDAVAPAYKAYVDADEALDADKKKRRLRTLSTWRLRLEQAETPVSPGEAPAGE